MASPPFNPATTTPQDNDLVSQYPLAERTFRDIMNSWVLVNHNNNGQHTQLTMPQIATPATPAAGIMIVYQSTTGTLAFIDSTGTVQQVGPPVGAVMDFAGSSAPNGWLLCFGQAVSRSTFANLFSILGTTYGAGDGSTTFNLPDLRGRVTAGVDNMGGSAANRIGSVVTDSGTITGATLGSVGGSSTHAQTTGELATHSHANTLSDPGHGHNMQFNGGASSATISVGTPVGACPAGAGNPQCGSATINVVSNTTGITISNVNAGSGNAMAILPPMMMLNKIIKY